MLKSMTGYGRANCEFAGVRYIIEIKSVNNKILNLNLRTPLSLAERENELRTELSRILERGSITLTIEEDRTQERSANKINESVVIDYYHQIQKIGEKLFLDGTNFLGQALRMPGIFIAESSELQEDFWSALLKAIHEAVRLFEISRTKEWSVLEKDIQSRIDEIERLSKQIEAFESVRIDRIKERIRWNLEEFFGSEKIDQNRFEQEIIYYLEQMDFTEEKVRLAKHCGYFRETIDQAGANGKKLDFIAQEIGREINTTGSKARDADIQKIVVQMKDELEKIKEQLANVL